MNPSPLVAEIIGPDILIILVIVALLFGSSRLPKLARSLGSAKSEFEKGLAEGAGAAIRNPTSPDDEMLSLTRSELDALIAQREASARSTAASPSKDPSAG